MGRTHSHPWRAQIESSSRTLKGHVYALRLTPELWTLCLPHRTQILYMADIAMIVSRLGLRPGSIAVETGTGSGSLTHALARAVAPTGRVCTYEFNAHRVECAREEFRLHGLSEVVTVAHRDSVADGFTPECVPGSASGVFLDLPNPWGAVKHALHSLARGGVLCSFSPCMEQVTKTVSAMTAAGMGDIRCMETLLRPWEALDGTAPAAPIDLTIGSASQAAAALAAAAAVAAGRGSGLSAIAVSGNDKGSGASAQVWRRNNAGVGGKVTIVPAADVSGRRTEGEGGSRKRPRTEGESAGVVPVEEAEGGFKPWPVLEPLAVRARPLQEARGHTGYLVFAVKYR